MTASSPLTTGEALLAITGLTVVTLLTRGFFIFTRREIPFPNWLREGLHYAPLAALAAVVLPEIVMRDGRLVTTLLDARLFAAAAGAAWFFWRRGILGTIVAGMAVFLPLRLGLGW
ncbi:MAG: AzlD domain-containing protein [Rubrivivax sp.]|jgi:branched-subunit amino acid transport protein|nr:AzlD domain-containing protein [Rubrivivax sp.]MCL4699645.1 AzlD domain-containing protein [Burkholderiaceae bacterium]